MNLLETVIYCNLEGVSLCWNIPIQSACTQWLWRESCIWHEHESHFHQGVLAPITLVESGAEDRGARAWSRCEPGLLFCSLSNTTLLGAGVCPKLMEQKPWGLVRAGPVPSECVLALLPALAPLPRVWQYWSKKAWSRCSEWIWAWAVATLAPVIVPVWFWCAASVSPSNGCPWPVQMLSWFWVGSASHNWALPSATAAFTLVWSCTMLQTGLVQTFTSGWSPLWGGHGKLARVPCIDSLNVLSLPCFGSKQVCMHSSQEESKFLTALL